MRSTVWQQCTTPSHQHVLTEYDVDYDGNYRHDDDVDHPRVPFFLHHVVTLPAFKGVEGSIPLRHNHFPGALPSPGAVEPVLVRGCGAKETLSPQAWVREEKFH